MGLPKKLLEKLACPQCKGYLEYRENPERLDCLTCKLGFSVAGGIPVLLIDEAKRL